MPKFLLQLYHQSHISLVLPVSRLSKMHGSPDRPCPLTVLGITTRISTSHLIATAPAGRLKNGVPEHRPLRLNVLHLPLDVFKVLPEVGIKILWHSIRQYSHKEVCPATMFFFFTVSFEACTNIQGHTQAHIQMFTCIAVTPAPHAPPTQILQDNVYFKDQITHRGLLGNIINEICWWNVNNSSLRDLFCNGGFTWRKIMSFLLWQRKQCMRK